MPYLILADIVVVLHFAFILFVIFGGLSLLRWHRMIWLHLPAFIWGMLILYYQFICPLTPLENWLLIAGGAQPYQGGFIGHYLLPIIYTPVSNLPIGVNTVLAICTLSVNGFVYGREIRHFIRSRTSRKKHG